MPRSPIIDLSRLIARLSARLSPKVADAWAQAVFKAQRRINSKALRAAILSQDVGRIERVLRLGELQRDLARALEANLKMIMVRTGEQSAQVLRARGVMLQFNARRDRIAFAARQHAAALVKDVARETRTVIAEIVALGAEGGLTTVQQARAIREVVGLPKVWSRAPRALADEIREGRAGAATNRRLSGADKQEIRSRIANGTVDEPFVARMQATYAQRLVNMRAKTIARTESSRAAHAGLAESWQQAVDAGVLPRTIRRFWIVTPDDRLCKICRRIPGMNPSGRGLAEPFMTPEGPVMQPPAPHPRCRCSVGLVIKPAVLSIVRNFQRALRRVRPRVMRR